MDTKFFIRFLVVVMLGIASVGIVSADISDLVKVCPNGKVLNESENLNLSVKIFSPYNTSVNATINVSLPDEFKNTSFLSSKILSPGFNNLVFPLEVKEHVQYKGDNANIVVDGNGNDWINVTRNKTDSLDDENVSGNCVSVNYSAKASYDIKETKVNYNQNNDTLYFLVEINPNGTIGNSNNQPTSTRRYWIHIDTNNDNTSDFKVYYENNQLKTSPAQSFTGNIIGNFSNNVMEISIQNASGIPNLNLSGFSIKVSTEYSDSSTGCPVQISDCIDWYYISFCESRNLTLNVGINFLLPNGTTESINKNLTYEAGCIPQKQYCGDGICNSSLGENCANCCDCFENPNVTLTKDASSFVVAGSNTNFSVKVKNNGMCPIYNLTLIDIMPNGFTNLTLLDKILSYLKGNEEYLWDISANSSRFVEGDNANIVVDGNGNDWINVTRNKTDSLDDENVSGNCVSVNYSAKASYDIKETKVNYNQNNDTLYFLVEINPNGTIGNSNNQPTSTRRYWIHIDTNNDNTSDFKVYYENNQLKTSPAQSFTGNIIGNFSNNVMEISIQNASGIPNLNLSGFSIKVSTEYSDSSVGCPVQINDCTEWYYITFCKDKTLTNLANLTAYSENGTQVNLNASANITVSCKGCNNTITCSCYRDADIDGYGNRTENRTVSGCNTNCSALCAAQQPKYVADSSDCNDNNTSINQGATEIYNGADDNCNGQIDEEFCDSNKPCSSGYSCDSNHRCYYSGSTGTGGTRDTGGSSSLGSGITNYATQSGGCQQDTACGTFDICYKTKCYAQNGDEDKDKINNSDERDKYKTDMLSNDTDKDGISDYDEIFVHKTDPLKDADKDGDGIKDSDEILKYKTNPGNKDTDGDGVSDYDEIFVYKTNPLRDEDKDTDGIKDSEEILKYKTNPLSNDTDSDKITDYDEIFTYKTDPTKSDTDGDGSSDYDEIFVYKTDPLKSDSDGDGITDYDEIFTHKTDPLLDADKDGDGIKDSEEILKYKTSATSNDTDNDSISDYDEIFTYAKYNLNPLSNDTDGDGASDYDEIFKYKTNPGDAKDKPGNFDIWWLIILALFLLLILLLLFLLAKRRKKASEETVQPKEEGGENEGSSRLGGGEVKQETSPAGQSAGSGLGSVNSNTYKPIEKGGQSGGLGGI